MGILYPPCDASHPMWSPGPCSVRDQGRALVAGQGWASWELSHAGSLVPVGSAGGQTIPAPMFSLSEVHEPRMEDGFGVTVCGIVGLKQC